MDNKLDYYLSKIERQLDFHRGLHLFEMEMNPNFTNKAVFLKESQEEYITNLFGNNKNIRESYNRKFNNVIVESTFNPKDEVKKFFSFLKENYINEINKTNIINEQSSKTFINEQWQRGADPIGYWTILFNQLKTAGIGVKWEVANNPAKSTYMYWGGWQIWKDENKNYGYPVSFTDSATNVSMTFKFKGGKYAGQPSNNIIIEPKSITVPFNLGQFGKLSNKVMSATITKYQKSNPKEEGFLMGLKNKISNKYTDLKNAASASWEDYLKRRAEMFAKMTPEEKEAFLKNEEEERRKQKEEWVRKETEEVSNNVFAQLKVAFDLNKNNVYDDYDGTNESGALAAVNLITTKNILDRVNQLIAASAKPYDGLKAWINDEMSDIDRDTYKAMWDRLGKLGYEGYIKNDFLAATGKGDIVGMAKAGFNWLKEKGIPWFMEKLRDALGSTAGAVLQSLLDLTGIGAIGVSVLWAALTLFDVWQISSGAGGWAKLFFSVIGLLSAGALAKTVGTFLKPLFGAGGGGTIGSFFSGIANKPWFIKYIKPVVGWIGSKISGAASLLTQAGEWVVKKLGATVIGGMVTKAVQWLKSIAENIVKFAGAGAKAETQSLAKAEVKTQGEKLIAQAVVDPLKDKVKDKVKEKVIQGSEYVGGTRGKAAAELAYGVQDLKGSSGDLGSAIKKGDYVKTAEKAVDAYDNLGNVVDQGTQVVTNEPKKV